MKPKIDRRTLMLIKGCKTDAKLIAFLEKFYEQAFKDGANADVDPNISYVAIKKGVRYECGCCGVCAGSYCCRILGDILYVQTQKGAS